MKKWIRYGMLLTTAAIFAVGCGSKKTIPALQEAGELTLNVLEQKLSGVSQEEIAARWGEPEGEGFGMDCEIYVLDGEKTLTVYYGGENRTVESVRFGSVSHTFEGTIKEVKDSVAVVEIDEGFDIRGSGDQVFVSLDEESASAKAGDRVRVSYSGGVMETYPLQINQESIQVISQTELDAKSESGEDATAVNIIGGTDGSTSIFLAGKLGDGDTANSDNIPLVMVDGALYFLTGESNIDGRCGNMDGEITEAVDGSEVPTKDNQSNFGTGYGYQYVDENQLDVYMPYGNPDEWRWMRFVKIGAESAQQEPYVIKTYEVTDPELMEEDSEADQITMVKYYEMSDGTWKTDTHTYQYRLEITGRMNLAVKDSTFVFLSNRKDITFEQAWKAAGFSSNMDDYFDENIAKFVAMK